MVLAPPGWGLHGVSTHSGVQGAAGTGLVPTQPFQLGPVVALNILGRKKGLGKVNPELPPRVSSFPRGLGGRHLLSPSSSGGRKSNVSAGQEEAVLLNVP